MKNETYIANVTQPGRLSFYPFADCYWTSFHTPAEKHWKLGRSVNGFTLAEGQEWHREDFTREMLPEGWRPLLKDEEFYEGQGNDEYYVDWKKYFHWQMCRVSKNDSQFKRTRRPLPDPYEELKAAHAAGKVIQCMSLGNWIDIDPVWNCAPDKYRIKPDPAPDADGWIPHDGGKMPVSGDVEVECKLDGEPSKLGATKAQDWIWSYESGAKKITHYRIAKPSEKKFVQWIDRLPKASSVIELRDLLIEKFGEEAK